MKLKSKRYIQHSGYVYDIGVNTSDHSYIINGAVVHNSAGGCLISYLIGIISVDPLEYDLLFERFLTNERCGLVPQDATVVGDDVLLKEGDEIITLVLEDGKEMDIMPDSELVVNRGGEKMKVYGDELLSGDDILFDRRDELYEVKEIEV